MTHPLRAAFIILRIIIRSPRGGALGGSVASLLI
jgi:hypothetical protein